jgi:hypothetical protein
MAKLIVKDELGVTEVEVSKPWSTDGIFDKEGNLKGNGELRYIKEDLGQGRVGHALISGNIRLSWFTKNGKFLHADICGHDITKYEYDLIAHMVRINDGAKEK